MNSEVTIITCELFRSRMQRS